MRIVVDRRWVLAGAVSLLACLLWCGPSTQRLADALFQPGSRQPRPLTTVLETVPGTLASCGIVSSSTPFRIPHEAVSHAGTPREMILYAPVDPSLDRAMVQKVPDSPVHFFMKYTGQSAPTIAHRRAEEGNQPMRSTPAAK